MAEKEERIVILTTKPKVNCPNQIDKDYCKETCWVKGKCSLGMTRQEAIRKMCDAYFKAKDKGLMESERVEAALNALLEGK